MRQSHVLKGHKGNAIPHVAVWMDTETDQIPIGPGLVKHVLRFGWLAYRRRIRGGKWGSPQWFRFETPAEYWDIVEGLRGGKNKVYMFAHNGAFDYPVVDTFNQLPERGWTLNKAVIDSPPVILQWRKAPRSILMLDTLNIWRMPLDQLGKQQGIPKLPMPPIDAPAEQWDTYCRRDVEVIMQACVEWWAMLEANDLGGFAPTLASQALRTYRHRFMPCPILIDDSETACQLAREAYHGGRVEAFRIGRYTQRLFQYDVNSMYPYVMATQAVPVRLISTTDRATVEDLAAWCRTRAVVADVLIDTPSPDYAVVHGGRLVHPVGRFRAQLCTPELIHALARGRVLWCHRAAVYVKAELFAKYVDYFYTRRLQLAAAGDAAGSWQYKILLNSLYGKFGQSGRVYQEVGTVEDMTPRVWTEYDIDTGEVRKLRQLCGLIQEWHEEGESRDSHPAIAAHITAAARMHLTALIHEAGPDNVLYVDTDSLLVNEAGSLNLAHRIDPVQLGALKLEAEWLDVEIHGAKDYRLGDKVKIKGVRKSARWIAADRVEQEQWTTLVGLLRAGDLSAPRTQRLEKTLSRRYTKGVPTPSGKVLPLTLGRGRPGD